MTRITRNLFIALFGVSLSWIGLTNAQACDGGGGGYYRPAPRPVCSYSNPYRYNDHYSPQAELPPVDSQYGYEQAPAIRPRPVKVAQPVQTISSSQQVAKRTVTKRVTTNAVATTQPRMTTQPQTTAPQNRKSAAQMNAEMSALQALASFGGDAQSADQQIADASGEQPQTLSHIGNWTARLDNGVTIELALQADGSFRWSAMKDGKASNFQGQYTFENGSLTLIRADGNQQLAGLVSTSNEGFNFKLNNAQDGGLNFARS